MFGLESLDILIGIVTVYLVLGIACTAIVETIASWARLRARNLETALNEMLGGAYRSAANDKEASAFLEAFYAHPLIRTLSKGEDGRPSYIPPKIVSRVVEALLKVDQQQLSICDAINALPGDARSNPLKGLLQALLAQTNGQVTEFRHALEEHFNAVMDRASGWYKRHTQNIALLAASVLVIGGNVDTLTLANSLASNPQMRVQMLAFAADVANNAQADLQTLAEHATAETGNAATSSSDNNARALTEAIEKSEAVNRQLRDQATQLSRAGLKMGWETLPQTPGDWLAKVGGLLISIVAISLGAPFWFSVLQRFMKVRATGMLPDGNQK